MMFADGYARQTLHTRFDVVQQVELVVDGLGWMIQSPKECIVVVANAKP